MDCDAAQLSHRFVIGSDTFINDGPEQMQAVRRFVDALLPDVATAIARDNAKRLYRWFV